MQRPKEDIKKHIQITAQELFLQKGYQKASMREIAEKSGVGLGNIYNYYANKDELFRTIVSPVIAAFEKMLQNHHGNHGEDVMNMCSETYFRETFNEYMSLMKKFHSLLEILLFRAQGSSLEHFRIDYTERSTEIVKVWFADVKSKYPALNTSVSDFFIHLHGVWMFVLFEELIMHHIQLPDMETIISEYIQFEIQGWRYIIKI